MPRDENTVKLNKKARYDKIIRQDRKQDKVCDHAIEKRYYKVGGGSPLCVYCGEFEDEENDYDYDYDYNNDDVEDAIDGDGIGNGEDKNDQM